MGRTAVRMSEARKPSQPLSQKALHHRLCQKPQVNKELNGVGLVPVYESLVPLLNQSRVQNT